MPVAAAIGIGSIATGVLGYMGAKNAADQQAQAAANALALQRQIYERNQQNLQPFISAGSGAVGQLSNIYGPNGVTQQGTAAFANSPDFQFALQQGDLGLSRYLNATGMGLSGAALKDVSQFNQGLATQQFGNYFSRLMSLSQLGANSASALAGNNTNMSGQMGNTTMALGQAQASGIVGGTNALTGSINNGITNSLLYNYMMRNPSGYAAPMSLSAGNIGGIGGNLGGLY